MKMNDLIIYQIFPLRAFVDEEMIVKIDSMVDAGKEMILMIEND